MNIDEILSTFVSTLKTNDYFDDIKIIKPYPNVCYAGEIKDKIVCVGLDEIEILPMELGYNGKYANVKINVGIYVSKNNSGAAQDIFMNICKAVYDLNIVSVKSQPIEYSKIAKAYNLNCSFSFNCKIDFGGESGE